MKVKVYLALVQHCEGEGLYAGGTKKELTEKLYEYVAQSWGDFMEGIPIPKSKKAAVSQYFDEAKDHGSRGEFLTYEEETITLPERKQ